MREVPRLLDDSNDEETGHEPREDVPKEIEWHNTSIVHTPVKPWINNTTPIPSHPSTLTSVLSLPTRGSQSTSSDPSMIDGFLVPISVHNSDSDIQFDSRRNKSLSISDQNKWDYSSEALPPVLDNPESIGNPIEELSLGSPVLHFNKLSLNTSEQTAKPLVPIGTRDEASPAVVDSHASNSADPTLNTNLSLDSAKTKKSFRLLFCDQ